MRSIEGSLTVNQGNGSPYIWSSARTQYIHNLLSDLHETENAYFDNVGLLGPSSKPCLPNAERDSQNLIVLCVFSRIQSYGNATITGEGLQILTYTRHWWPLSSEGYLACQTYSDTGIRSSPRTSDASSHQFPSACSEVVTTCSNDLRLSRPGIEPRSPACEANALQLSQRGGSAYLITNIQLLYTSNKCKFHFTWV